MRETNFLYIFLDECNSFFSPLPLRWVGYNSLLATLPLLVMVLIMPIASLFATSGESCLGSHGGWEELHAAPFYIRGTYPTTTIK